MLVEAVPLICLLALLVVAYRHPRPAVEAGVAVLAAGAALLAGVASGVLPLDDARRAVLDLAPVVVFLATILVVSEVCGRAGLFAALGALLRGGPTRLVTLAFLLAAVVTAVLSLDATVVLLTPVVVAAARGAGVSARPGAWACLRMANSASLLLPVSNLTNLLALPHLEVGFLGFAARMTPVLLVVLLVEYAALRLAFRRELAPAGPGHTSTATSPATPPATPPLPPVPAAVVVAMLAGFVVTSPFDLAPAWISGAAAVVLTGWARHRGLASLPDAVGSLKLEFSLFVLALGVVVAALGDGVLGDLVADLVPASTGFLGLLGIAVLATVLANLVTNLSATLLLVPVVAPLGDVAVLAALLGLNIGSGLTLSGSLANLLWRRVLAHEPDAPRETGVAAFHRLSLTVTPVVLVAAVAALAFTST